MTSKKNNAACHKDLWSGALARFGKPYSGGGGRNDDPKETLRHLTTFDAVQWSEFLRPLGTQAPPAALLSNGGPWGKSRALVYGGGTNLVLFGFQEYRGGAWGIACWVLDVLSGRWVQAAREEQEAQGGAPLVSHTDAEGGVLRDGAGL